MDPDESDLGIRFGLAVVDPDPDTGALKVTKINK